MELTCNTQHTTQKRVALCLKKIPLRNLVWHLLFIRIWAPYVSWICRDLPDIFWQAVDFSYIIYVIFTFQLLWWTLILLGKLIGLTNWKDSAVEGKGLCRDSLCRARLPLNLGILNKWLNSILKFLLIIFNHLWKV